MTSFSSLLSSVGKPAQPQSPAVSSPKSATSRPQAPGDRFKLTANNAAAGAKRRSEEPASGSVAKAAKTEQNGVPSRPTAAPSGRFQLSKPGQPSSRPNTPGNESANLQRPATRPSSRPAISAPGTPTEVVQKKGFAAILERAKAQQAAKKDAMVGVIKHKPVEKLSRKEREKLFAEQKAQQKRDKKAGAAQNDRSRSGTPVGKAGASLKKPAEPVTYKGTMKKASPEPISYKGTMKAAGSVPKPVPKKGAAQDKYGGYASWSDLDEAEDEDEEDYDSEDDMEAGFDDMEHEETAALKAARKEDLEALEEEERHRREKLERKKKLEALSKSAAARKRY
ncbi:SPT2 chromatin protein [Teratosphaeria destructans]|uniref:SPT2 chromatin protein n=1 Tax=Teratosphaeria destructans TaxID=418781 RepID=A0A9W7SNN5_9PEZI|nr:SPT2 chromatin protein [Teratosphaeria destructans]